MNSTIKFSPVSSDVLFISLQLFVSVAYTLQIKSKERVSKFLNELMSTKNQRFGKQYNRYSFCLHHADTYIWEHTINCVITSKALGDVLCLEILFFYFQVIHWNVGCFAGFWIFSPLNGTVKWGESGPAERVGTKFRFSKTETHLHEQTFWFSEALRRSIENSLCTTKNSPVQSILCFQGSKLRPNSPRQSRLAPLYGNVRIRMAFRKIRERENFNDLTKKG